MRRQNTLNQAHKSTQQGFALFIVLIMMMVIALLIVAATQSYNTEQRISSNDSDRKLTMSIAEAALHEGENRIVDFEDSQVTFTENCLSGLCTAPNTKTPSGNTEITVTGSPSELSWLRKCNEDLCIDSNGSEFNLGKSFNVSKNPRYIIEYLNTNDSGATIYRVTAKAWGKNSNTVVILQSYVSSE